MNDDVQYAKKKIDDIINLSNANPLSDLEHAERALAQTIHAGLIIIFKL
jgi:hypothetical protein